MGTHKRPLLNERGAVAIEYSMKLSLICLGLLVGTTQIGTSAETTFYTVGFALEGDSSSPLMSGGESQAPGGTANSSGGGTEQEFEVAAEDGVDGPPASPATPSNVPLP